MTDVEQDIKSGAQAIPGFLTKTFEIFSLPEYNYCCEWGRNGTTIVVTKIEEFSKQVLPKYFKHSNFQSFVRQLNMYDFHKLVQDPNNGEFTHQHFLRDQPDKIALIKRKANNKVYIDPRRASEYLSDEVLEAKFGMKGEDFALEADSVINELAQQKLVRDNFEKRLLETEEKLNMLSKLESRQTYLEGENMFLKQMVIEARQKQAVMQDKMERVVGLLYNAYMSSGGALTGTPRHTMIDNGLRGLVSNYKL